MQRDALPERGPRERGDPDRLVSGNDGNLTGEEERRVETSATRRGP
jgi:hypothetical protein